MNKAGLYTAISLTVWAGAVHAAPATAKERPAKAASPKTGILTPGIQIPFSSLQSEAELSLPFPLAGFTVEKDPYVVLSGGGGVARIDTKKNQVDKPLEGSPAGCGGFAGGFGSLWVANCEKQSLIRLDAKSGKTLASIATGAIPGGETVAAASDSIWILGDRRTTLARVDPDTNLVVVEIRLPVGCQTVLAADAALWVSCPLENRVLRIDPATNIVSDRIETPTGPGALLSAGGSIWVLCQSEGKVVRIDPKIKKVVATVALLTPGATGTMAFLDDSLWISTPDFPLTRLETKAEKERVAQQFYGSGGGQIFSAAGSLWLAAPGSAKLLRIDPKRVVATLAN